MRHILLQLEAQMFWFSGDAQPTLICSLRKETTGGNHSTKISVFVQRISHNTPLWYRYQCVMVNELKAKTFLWNMPHNWRKTDKELDECDPPSSPKALCGRKDYMHLGVIRASFTNSFLSSTRCFSLCAVSAMGRKLHLQNTEMRQNSQKQFGKNNAKESNPTNEFTKSTTKSCRLKHGTSILFAQSVEPDFVTKQVKERNRSVVNIDTLPGNGELIGARPLWVSANVVCVRSVAVQIIHCDPEWQLSKSCKLTKKLNWNKMLHNWKQNASWEPLAKENLKFWTTLDLLLQGWIEPAGRD